MAGPPSDGWRIKSKERKLRMNRRKPRKGDLYRHFRGKQYHVLYLAVCAETKEEMVVYETAEGEHRVYVSSLAAFMRAVSKDKYPDAQQEYRFELCRDSVQEMKKDTPESEESLILQFLDLDGNEQRAEFLQKHRAVLTDRFLTAAAESMEFAENADTLEERYAALLRFLKTKMKYEGSRLR